MLSSVRYMCPDSSKKSFCISSTGSELLDITFPNGTSFIKMKKWAVLFYELFIQEHNA